jgi:hypothetical protein
VLLDVSESDAVNIPKYLYDLSPIAYSKYFVLYVQNLLRSNRYSGMIELDSNLLLKMTRQLKRWESPRNEGRNDKGKGGSARQRQLKKRTQMLRQKLKDQGKGKDNNNSQGQNKKRENHDSLSFLLLALNY